MDVGDWVKEHIGRRGLRVELDGRREMREDIDGWRGPGEEQIGTKVLR